jgi:hypothetical protein
MAEATAAAVVMAGMTTTVTMVAIMMVATVTERLELYGRRNSIYRADHRVGFRRQNALACRVVARITIVVGHFFRRQRTITPWGVHPMVSRAYAA